MKISNSDYLLLRFARAARPLLSWLGGVETSMLQGKLEAVPIQQPVFVSGLARAGTTILLELLAKVDGVATHRYRDFPFLWTPFLWNRYLDLASGKQEPVERAHRDRIQITAESPEAFEEPIWESFFADLHTSGVDQRLAAGVRQPGFERFFRDHVKKLMLLRGGDRYVSKGNYNLTRIEYLLELFPDARFVIPIRHPQTHVHSLVRMHQLFSDYAQRDARVAEYLAASGHYEFGPQRVPICFDAENRALAAWRAGDEYAGYAIQWADLYRHVQQLADAGGRIAESILVVRYEDFCSDPDLWFAKILEHAALPAPGTRVSLAGISRSPADGNEVSQRDQVAVWNEVREVAERFEYREDG